MKVCVIGGTIQNETTMEDKDLSVLLAAKGIKLIADFHARSISLNYCTKHLGQRKKDSQMYYLFVSLSLLTQSSLYRHFPKLDIVEGLRPLFKLRIFACVK
jgi:hypothetical protein